MVLCGACDLTFCADHVQDIEHTCPNINFHIITDEEAGQDPFFSCAGAKPGGDHQARGVSMQCASTDILLCKAHASAHVLCCANGRRSYSALDVADLLEHVKQATGAPDPPSPQIETNVREDDIPPAASALSAAPARASRFADKGAISIRPPSSPAGKSLPSSYNTSSPCTPPLDRTRSANRSSCFSKDSQDSWAAKSPYIDKHSGIYFRQQPQCCGGDLSSCAKCGALFCLIHDYEAHHSKCDGLADLLWNDERCFASDCMDPYNIRECELCPEESASYACKSHMSLHSDESHPPHANPIASRLWPDVSALRKAKEGLRATSSAAGRRPDTRPPRSPPSEVQSVTTKRHRSDYLKPSEEAHPAQSRTVETIDLCEPNVINRGSTNWDRTSQTAGPMSFRAGNGPLAVGHAGGRGGRGNSKDKRAEHRQSKQGGQAGNSKDRRAERRQSKQGGQARPNVASVAKAVCFYSPHVYDVISTGGAAQYDAPPVVRQSYHQDRPRTYSEAAGGQPKGPAPLGVATRYSHYSPP